MANGITGVLDPRVKAIADQLDEAEILNPPPLRLRVLKRNGPCCAAFLEWPLPITRSNYKNLKIYLD